MEYTAKILLCEDDENLGMLLREYLITKGYDTTLCYDGEEGLKAFQNDSFDICILDVMMPKKDGFTLAMDIRHINTSVPIVFLTARALKEDIIEGFRIGADDYLTKPFSMEELTFRVEAILRRVQGTKVKDKNVYSLGDYVFDKQKQTLSFGEESKKLTTKENDLLLLLCQNMNEILQRDFALKKIWVDDNYFNARSMDVYITKLRKLLSKDERVQIINVHGKGYKLVCDAQQEANE